MITTWTQIGPPILTAFLASMVEFVEALTVVLAVGSVRGWRDTLIGSAAALGLLMLIVAAFGAALKSVPLGLIQLGVGTLLVLVGLRWLRKAILRFAGAIPLRDEAAAFARQTEAMRGRGKAEGWDPVAFGAAFQITMLEGAEVVFIVIAVGAGGAGLLLPACLGAFAALLIVATLGVAIHRPLARIPDNSLKFLVGVLLSAFGTFWLGEAIETTWPGGDWSILGLIGGYFAAASLAVRLCRSRIRPRRLVHGSEA